MLYEHLNSVIYLIVECYQTEQQHLIHTFLEVGRWTLDPFFKLMSFSYKFRKYKGMNIHYKSTIINRFHTINNIEHSTNATRNILSNSLRKP